MRDDDEDYENFDWLVRIAMWIVFGGGTILGILIFAGLLLIGGTRP